MRKAIIFSHNWNNKLDNDIFTTIRTHTSDKEKYYRKNIEEEFDIVLNCKDKCIVKLVGVDVKRFDKINDDILILDTGLMSIIDIEKVFYRFGMNTIKDKMIILMLKKI